MMKKENKLALKKVTISNLVREQMKEVLGGENFTWCETDWGRVTEKETNRDSCVSGPLYCA